MFVRNHNFLFNKSLLIPKQYLDTGVNCFCFCFHFSVKFDCTTKCKDHWEEAQIGISSNSIDKVLTIGVKPTARGTTESYSSMICDSINHTGNSTY